LSADVADRVHGSYGRGAQRQQRATELAAAFLLVTDGWQVDLVFAVLAGRDHDHLDFAARRFGGRGCCDFDHKLASGGPQGVRRFVNDCKIRITDAGRRLAANQRRRPTDTEADLTLGHRVG